MVEQLDVWCAPAATTHGFTKIEKVFPGVRGSREHVFRACELRNCFGF